MAKPTPRPPASGDRVALALADAALLGDDRAAEKHQVSRRTIRRWRAEADTKRPEVAKLVSANVQEARQAATAEWKGVVDATISEAVAYIRWAAKVPDEGRPSAMMVQSLTVAMKALHEIAAGSGGDTDKNRPITLIIKKASGPSGSQ